MCVCHKKCPSFLGCPLLYYFIKKRDLKDTIKGVFRKLYMCMCDGFVCLYYFIGVCRLFVFLRDKESFMILWINCWCFIFWINQISKCLALYFSIYNMDNNRWFVLIVYLGGARTAFLSSGDFSAYMQNVNIFKLIKKDTLCIDDGRMRYTCFTNCVVN